MICRKCKKEIADGSSFCNYCGQKQTKPKQKSKSRGNGQGSVYKNKNGTWTAAKVIGYHLSDSGRTVADRVTKSGFATKTEALQYIPQLPDKPTGAKKRRAGSKLSPALTLRQIYELWLPVYETRGRSQSTLNCYKAAYKRLEALDDVSFGDIGIDDWQSCIDECPNGRRTKENMRTLIGLLYKYAIPRGAVPEKLNLAEYLTVTGDHGRRQPFTPDEVQKIQNSIGKILYADYVYCHIYLGYRPHEFITLSLSRYNAQEHYFTGGAKTQAGKNRIVTISPKIQPFIDRLAAQTNDLLFLDENEKPMTDKKYRAIFYDVIAKSGIQNTEERKLSPYSCRHTFASMMDKIAGGDNAKLELMGHTDIDMLRHYQHADLDLLRKITDNI